MTYRTLIATLTIIVIPTACTASTDAPVDPISATFDGFFEVSVIVSTDRTASLARVVSTSVRGSVSEGTPIHDARRCAPIVSRGACTAYAACSPPLSEDVGAVTTMVGDRELLTLFPRGASYASAFEGSGFTPGEIITITGEGGLRMPPFEVQVVAPNDIEPRMPRGFVSGEDVEITWSPTTSVDMVDIAIATLDASILCVVEPTAGSVVVDAALTESISGPVSLSVRAVNVSSVVVEEGELETIDEDRRLAIVAATTTAEVL